MNYTLPTNAFSLKANSFHHIVEEFCGKEVVELLKFQLIDPSIDLIDIDDVFSILQFELDRTISLKEILDVSARDKTNGYSFFVMPGIRLKLERFIRSLRSLSLPIDSSSSSSSSVKSLTISSDLIEQYSLLIDLVYCLESNLSSEFLLDFISNMLNNITRSKNYFRYGKTTKDFAASLFILGGRNAYEFVRLNLAGFIPSVSSLRSALISSKFHYVEGEFQYERLKNFVNSIQLKYSFCGEDSTSVVPKISYDTRSNSFIGFTLPLRNELSCA